MKKKKREHFRAVALIVSVLFNVFVVSPLKLVKDYEKVNALSTPKSSVGIRFADLILNNDARNKLFFFFFFFFFFFVSEKNTVEEET